MSKVTKALILVRAGSTRVKNKNIKPFANSNLLEIKIKQLLRIKELDSIIVNSECDEMLEIAKNLGVETFKRDPYYSTNEICPNDLYRYVAENSKCDTLVFANATNPLIKDGTISECINFYYETKEYDSVNTVNEVKEFLWLGSKAINFDPCNKPRSQDLPEILSLNHAISVIDRNLAIKRKDILGAKPYFKILDKIEGADIDYEVDFQFAEFVYKKLYG